MLGPHDVADQRVDARQRLEVVDADAAHRARTELGLHHRREPDVGGRGEQLVERPHPLGARRRQPERGGQSPGCEPCSGRRRPRRAGCRAAPAPPPRVRRRRCCPPRTSARRPGGRPPRRARRRRCGVRVGVAVTCTGSHATAMPSSTSDSDQWPGSSTKTSRAPSSAMRRRSRRLPAIPALTTSTVVPATLTVCSTRASSTRAVGGGAAASGRRSSGRAPRRASRTTAARRAGLAVEPEDRARPPRS